MKEEDWNIFVEKYTALCKEYGLCVVSWDGEPAIVPMEGHFHSPGDLYFELIDHYDYVMKTMAS